MPTSTTCTADTTCLPRPTRIFIVTKLAFILLKNVYEKLPFMYYNVLALDCHRRSYCLDSYIAELLSSPTRAVGPLGTLTVMGNSVGCGSGL